jgi:hypothetical protein
VHRNICGNESGRIGYESVNELPLWLPCGYVNKDAAKAKSRRRSIPDEILSLKDLQYNWSSEILNFLIRETNNTIA